MSGRLSPRPDRVRVLLEAELGRPERRLDRDVLGALVRTILSQHTSDTNSLKAYDSLRRAFPSWERAADAQPGQLADAIRNGGLADQKAARIWAILDRLRRDQGRPTLALLKKMEPDRAYEYLVGMDGVGPKTAACVMLFALGARFFPVDTHIARIAARLGWWDGRGGIGGLQRRVADETEPEHILSLHMNLIELGRRVCKPRNPACGRCPLARVCPGRDQAA